ncbi:MAG TPA: IS30 family transposase [Streptosporangiaceae bacterium]|nr:IS30 family transposase [Streptosporangiaceae bacterium]
MVLGYLEAGLNPMRAARAAGVSKSFVYRLDATVSGVSRLAAKRAAAARREADQAAAAARAAERVRALLDLLAAGMSPNQAGPAAGVSKSAAYRLHHRMGGVYRPPGTTYSDRYLDREERYEIARLRESGCSMREIGRRTGRSASTISRELGRNADPRTGGYQPERAHRLAWERQRRPKPSKLARNPALRAEAQQLLDRRHSPEQASGRLTVLYPDDPGMRVSHETIYQSIYVYPRGELRRELRACLRSGREIRRRRGRREVRGTITDAVPTGQRPPEAEGRLVPGHHEGDLIMGSKASNSAVGTIVERTTGYLTLLPLHDGHTAAAVADAIIDRLGALPAWFAKTLTWDRGTELAHHQRITATTGINVYFAGPRSPWQRGSNENINGLLREYLPQGTDLSAWTPAQLQAIAGELNDRPRKRFGYHTPREQLAKLLADDQRVATTP